MKKKTGIIIAITCVVVIASVIIILAVTQNNRKPDNKETAANNETTAQAAQTTAAELETKDPSQGNDTVIVSGTYRLPVFETTDVHGYIASKEKDEYEYRLAYVSDKVKDVRGYGDKYEKDYALLLDAGDIFQGSIMSNMLNGAPIAAAYELMGYDAVTICNHEFDWLIENTVDSDGTMMDGTEAGFEQENTVPVVASNLFQNGEKPEWVDDFVIVTKKARNEAGDEIDVRIGIIGYLEDYGIDIMQSRFEKQGFEIKKDESIPNDIARAMEENGAADVTILLCHADAEGVANDLGEDSVVDLVLGGHTHKEKNGIADNGIPYIESDKYGVQYSYAELVFTAESYSIAFDRVDNAAVFDVAADKSYKTDENAEDLDETIVALTDQVIDRVASLLETEIGYITVNAQKKGFIEGSGNRATTGGNWMSSVYMRALDADVAFVNRGAVRYDFVIPEGSDRRVVTLGEIMSDYPFMNEMYKYEATYEDLLSVMEFTMKDNEEREYIVSLMGIDCYFVEDEVDALVKDGELIYRAGEWFGDWRTKTLTIATNQFLATAEEELGGMMNPLPSWNETDRLLEHYKIDYECAVEVLTAEAEANDGYLYIDVAPHIIEGRYAR
ncbi:MAG: 5'-nucleotidase C-terminal domain-containing protein [Lachnospiraceae bacterium]|nr:5'-nucleotidase C-terminal domain-containing protein [Lachnospiraceae bacterium]